MAFIVNRFHFPNRSIYTVNLHGTHIITTVTATPSIVRKWLSTTLYHRRYDNCFVVGLGVQWTPHGDPPAETLQLCIGHRCLIFQLCYTDRVPLKLRRFLMDPDNTFVGFWNHSDRVKLRGSLHRLEMCKDPVDLRLHVVTEYHENLSRAQTRVIVKKCLGYDVERGNDVSKSYWRVGVLSEEQVLYACVDAHCAFLVGRFCTALGN
ncbi:hypothetical protein RIF29_41111 [Crotalaria pallida]|uniref:Uncharacterized protein n=1 Tax=Crotalaria pallida TaxID=3830 RepID=A0AAN9E4S2_CROPI